MVDIDDAFAQVAAAIQAHGSAPEEVVHGLERLRGSVSRWLAGATGAISAPVHGRWLVTPAGRHVDLERRPTLKRLVAALVEARITKPGQALPASDLVAAGWADEPAEHEAAMNRLRVAICRLRQLGLESSIVTTSSGWMIDPNTPIVREPSLVPKAAVSAPELEAIVEEIRKPASGIFTATSIEAREKVA